jgi:quinoprotein glucose dehydrogenase
MTSLRRAACLGLLEVLAAPLGAEEPASQYSPLAQIRRDNVARLEIAWTYRTGEPLAALAGGGRPPAFEATPVYAFGLLYVGTPYGKAIALDPETGAERWSFDAKIPRDASFGDFANRGVSVWLDAKKDAGPCRERVFFASIDARLFALDARTGALCADFGRQGVVDLKTGLRRGPEYLGEYEQTSPPAVIDDLVIVGSAIADNHRAASVTGEVRAFDARTGALRWTFDPLPDNPDAGGANAWSRIVADPGRHLVFVPTGSPSPDYYGGLRKGDNGFANSVVALRAATGAVAWHFQTVHHDLWDYDVATPPALFTAERAGRTVAGVAVGSKTGHLFLLDRETGTPLFPVEERPVPASDVPGEEAARTQPFPTLPPALVPQRLAADQAWGASEPDRRWCREQIESLRSEGVFTPPSLRGTLVVPGNVGGLHWGGVAFAREQGLLITPTNRLAALARLVPQAEVAGYRKEHPDRETTRQRGAPYAMSRIFLRAPSGLPCNPPPFGTLSAVEVATGKLRWEVPLGQLPFPGALPEWGSINLGGPLATAGGLVFIGASVDPAIRAFDAATGALLWKGALPASARSVPMSFQGPSGKQYVVIAAGGHDPAFGPLDNAIVAFRLP